MIDIGELSNMLTDRADSVARYLLPNGREHGREWCAGSVEGEAGQSLKVAIDGGKKGVWKDFASGEGGDLIDLWVATRNIALTDALREIKDYLGVQEPTFEKGGKIKKFRRPDKPVNTSRLKAENMTPVMEYLTKDRGLSPEVVTVYKVCETSEVGPWENWKRQEPFKGPFITFPFLRAGNELIAVKYLHLKRKDGKKVTLVEAGCEPCCFGWHVIDPKARTVVICEGELDALSLYQYGHPAISVPFGGGKGDKQQWIDYDWAELERFDTIYLCLDNDDEGRIGTEEIVSRLGAHRCMIVKLPRKDANQCLTEHVPKSEIDEAFKAAESISPEELRSARQYYTDVLDEFYPAGGKLAGFDFPMDGIPFRFLRGEVSVITGVNGHGKSLLWGQVMMGATGSGERACIASLEMKPKKTLYRMVRQSCGTTKPPVTEISQCLDWMGENIWLFDLVGTSKIDRLLEVFRYAYRRHGVRQFVIDSLMKCGVSEDDYKAQKELMDRVCDFAIETDCHIHLIAHPRKGDDEHPPNKMDIKGTGAITDLAFNVFSVWRNKPKEAILHNFRETGVLPKGITMEEVERRADALLYVHKSRNVDDAEGIFAMYYHNQSMRFQRTQNEQVRVWHDGEAEEAPF